MNESLLPLLCIELMESFVVSMDGNNADEREVMDEVYGVVTLLAFRFRCNFQDPGLVHGL